MQSGHDYVAVRVGRFDDEVKIDRLNFGAEKREALISERKRITLVG